MFSCMCEIGQCVLCDKNLYKDISIPSSSECGVRSMICDESFKPRETLFQQGAKSTYLYILRKGQVKLMQSSPDGREQIIGLATPGHLLGFHNIEEAFHPYSATAMTPSVVCKVRHRSMFQLLQDYPSVSMHLVQTLNEELAQSHSLIYSIGRKNAGEKVASLILALAHKQNSTQEDIAITLSRLEVSEILGLTAETVSRIIAKLKRENIIDAPRGQFRILDRDRLEIYSGGYKEAEIRQG